MPAVSSRVEFDVAELRRHFNLFVYGTLRRDGKAASVLRACEHVGTGEVGGVLYSIEGEYPALVLYGNSLVSGEIWRCPNELLGTIDAYEGVDEGLFRRVGVRVRTESQAGLPCWTYVAGPALSRKLLPTRRIAHWPV